jgi:predicted porin
MKRNIAALAALGSCAAAFAQSTVTLYGVVDVGYTHGRGDVSSFSGLTSGRTASSRIGFRGTEDLGGGLAASFVLEADIGADSGAGVTTPLAGFASTDNKTPAANGSLQFNRVATVGLAGPWGEVKAGRTYTPTFLLDFAYDPFAQNGVGFNLITGTSLFYSAAGSVNHLRASNVVTYTSPRVGGFQGMAAFAPSETASNLPKEGGHVGLKLGYAAGPATADVAWGKTKNVAVGDIKTASFGAAYNFGMVKTMVEISQDELGAAGGNGKKRGWLLGATAPVGSGEVRASIAQVKRTANAAPDMEVRQLALGYVHHLSKRTALFVTVSHIRNDNYRNSATAGYAVGNAVTSPNGRVTAQDVGIRHVF